MSFEYGLYWSNEMRNASMARGQRVKRFNLDPQMKSQTGAWAHGPVIDRKNHEGPSLLGISRFLSSHGYDTYLLNSRHKDDPPVLVPVFDDFFLEPTSELCMHDPLIYKESDASGLSNDVNLLYCWNDAFVAKRGTPKSNLLKIFGLPASTVFSECSCL